MCDKRKTYLCQEDGEQFTIKANDLKEAQGMVEMWNAVVVKEIKNNSK